MKAVFLDRDGTLIVERGPITVPEMVELLPEVPEAIARLREDGWKVFLVTNQAVVARGLITEEELASINERIVFMLGAQGAMLDGVYTCPHHPEGTVPEYAIECGCRKPKPGLLEQAAREHGLDLGACVMIGDSARDLEAGRAVGATTILVRTGHGQATSARDHGADHVAEDLAGAVRWLVSRGP
jgi:D-glycero-D-manno-heptose 1,7-bisphosphate phosphatase